jgi:membrane-bound ClpP family serine protease
MSKILTVSTHSARPCRIAPTINQDAQDIANAIGRNVQMAVHQAISDVDSKRDAALRDEVAEVYGRTVANGLAGEALAELARQCRKKADSPITANSGIPLLTADVRNLPDDRQRFDEVPD